MAKKTHAMNEQNKDDLKAEDNQLQNEDKQESNVINEQDQEVLITDSVQLQNAAERKSIWVKDPIGNYSNNKKDTFDENKDYIGIRLQQGVPLLDRDWNEMEDLRRYQEMILRKNYVGDGTPDNGFEIKAMGSTDFCISRGRFLVDGIEAVNHKALKYSEQGLSKLTEPVDKRNDLVYIELAIKEVQGPKNEDDVKMETCIRQEVKWQVKVIEGSEELPKPEQFYWRSRLALLKRKAKELAIEDQRHNNSGFDKDLGSLVVNGKAIMKDGITIVKDATITGSITAEQFSKFTSGFQSQGNTYIGDLYIDKKLELTNSSHYQPDSDIAKLFYQSESQMTVLKQGDVVRLADDGGLIHTNIASDPLVVGVVSIFPRLTIKTSSVNTMPQNEKDNIPYKECMLVTYGVARCKVWKAENDKIKVGDFLTSYGKEGAAIKSITHISGAIIGRALEPYDDSHSGIKLLKILVLRS